MATSGCDIFLFVSRSRPSWPKAGILIFGSFLLRSRDDCGLIPPQQPVRRTKTFPTEAEAKQYAKEMLSETDKIIAGTMLSAHQPVRRIISGSELYRWIEKK